MTETNDNRNWRALAALCLASSVLLAAALAPPQAYANADSALLGAPPAPPEPSETGPNPPIAPPPAHAEALLLAQAAPQAPTPPDAPPAPAPRAYRVEAAEIKLRDLAAMVLVMTQDRADVAVEIVNPGALPAPRVLHSGRRVIIDGDLNESVERCRNHEGVFSVDIDGHGWVSQDRLPQIVIYAPRDLAIEAGGATQIRIDAARSANIAMSACGAADMLSVTGDADLSVSGGATVRILQAGRASVRIAGSGDIHLGQIERGLAASIAGGGDITADYVAGPTNIAIQGSGDVIIHDGAATAMSIAIAGAGDVVHNGTVEELDVVILGSGDVRVRRVSGA